MLKDIKKYFKNADLYMDWERSAYIAQVVCVMANLPLVGFAVRSLAADNNTYAAVNLFVCACNIIAFIIYRLLKRKLFIIYHVIVTYGILLLSLIVTGGESGSGAYWSFTYPMVIFVAGGLYRGTLFSSLFLLCAGVILLAPPAFLDAYVYHPDHRYRILSVLFYTTFMSFMMESTRLLVQVRWQESREQLAVLAKTDPLTGLLNRRGGMEALATELARSIRNNNDLSILMIDLDNFKRLNDTFGHSFGDDALVHVAKKLKQHTRCTDHVVRWGGEEFLIAMPNTSLLGAYKKAEMLRQAVEKSGVIRGLNRDSRLTISVGVSHTRAQASLDTLIRDADGKLYEAKHGGRNRVMPHLSANAW